MPRSSSSHDRDRPSPALIRRPIHDGWCLHLDTGTRERLGTTLATIAATVPGCVHTDLLDHGLIDDPYDDLNELDQQWIGLTDWTYATTLDLEPPDDVHEWQAELVFHGLDTFAAVRLDDVELGSTANQHRTHRFDVTDRIGQSAALEIAFLAPRTVALDERDRLGDLPNPYGEPYNFVRKMAANFGWDWGPTLTTAGIWRSVEVVFWHTARLHDVHVTPQVDADAAKTPGRIELDATIDCRDDQSSLRLIVEVAGPNGEVGLGSSAVVDRAAHVDVDFADVERWWPIGWGAQTRYRVSVRLESAELLDVVHHDVGFLTVEARRTPDDIGEAFDLVVNGRRLWVRGVNWIPGDCFPSRLTKEALRNQLTTAAQANVNLIRVWGGGVYESDDFYELCDELGLLVWQDFAFACAAYPELDLWDEIEAEARDNIRRLRTHPSLAVWNGNNENLEGWADWGWQDQVGDRPWGDRLYHELLPALVDELDGGRPYLDGSPTSFDTGAGPNDDRFGLVHRWDAWNDHDYDHYATHQPRFVAEFGYQGPATHATLRLDRTGAPERIDDPRLLHRQRAFDGHDKIERWRSGRFGPTNDLDTWLYQTQLNQARAVTESIGHFRSLHETCSGVIWWQLNDCWPAISWAVLDGEQRRKPAYTALKRALDPRLVAIRPTAAAPELVLVNDTAATWDVDVHLALARAETVIHRTKVSAVVEADSAHRLDLPAELVPTGVDVVVATVGDRRAWWSPSDDVMRAADQAPRFHSHVRTEDDNIIVSVTAETLVRDLCCLADRVDRGASVTEQLITLLPGESHDFVITSTNAEVDAWRVAIAHHRHVLRAALDWAVA